jgi:hypothetical protein
VRSLFHSLKLCLLIPVTCAFSMPSLACSVPYFFVKERRPDAAGSYRRFPDGQIFKVKITDAALGPDRRILAYRMTVIEGAKDRQLGQKLVIIAEGETWSCELLINPYDVSEDGMAEGYIELPSSPDPNGYFVPFRSSRSTEAAWNELQKNNPESIKWKPIKFERAELDVEVQE